MKHYLLITLLCNLGLRCIPAMSAVSLDNPPVLCPEEILPQEFICPDFTKVKNIYSDFPKDMSTNDIKDWKEFKLLDLRSCRSQEILRREKVKPGSFGADTLEEAWMISNASLDVSTKLNSIDEASLKYGIPPQVLIGSLKQESQLSTLGLSRDGGNYSCGIAQLNIQEWCESMNRLSDEKRETLGWPKIKCNSEILPLSSVKPFLDLAIKKSGHKSTYNLTAEDFNTITFEKVALKNSELFSKSKNSEKRFQAVTSFVNNCQNITLSIDAKAQTLKSLYDKFVPRALKEDQQYSKGETFHRSCAKKYPTQAYPLHSGWLLAVAMYNAGPLQVKLLRHYYQVRNGHYPEITPQGLIRALYWGGKWKENTNNIVFKDQSGNSLSQRWYKSCIVQRHIARVVQNVTVPDETIAKSLDKKGCSETGVPKYRRDSNGIDNN